MTNDEDSTNNDSAAQKEIEAIRLIIEQFTLGIRNLDAGIITKIFHPDALSFSLTSRGICIEPVENWPIIIKQANDNVTHLFRERFSLKILEVDVAGAAAMAKVEWTFETAGIIDFYNLLKIDGQWLIVNQVYHTFRPI